jgi:hypothetical protein
MAERNGGQRRRGFAADYEQTRREVAEHQVLDAAEDILGHAWVSHLERARHDAAVAVEAAVEVRAAARKLVRAAESDGERRRIEAAEALHARAGRDLADALAEARLTLAWADAQLRALGEATLARMRRRKSDVRRLRTARLAVAEEPGSDEP